MNYVDYNSILLPNEEFYSGHAKLTIFEIRDALNVMKIANRLPDCMWDDIKHNHATNCTTIWGLISRYNQIYYPDTIGVINKPSKSFLEWVYNGIQFASKNS